MSHPITHIMADHGIIPAETVDPITATRATAGQFGHPEDGGLIERIARAWAYMEGKGGRFDACKADPEQDRTEGYHSGYMAEAEELAERAGLFPTVAAIRALPAAQDGAETETEAELRRALAQIESLNAECDRRRAERDALKAENERLMRLIRLAHPVMRECGWQLAPACVAEGSDGTLEYACAQIEEAFEDVLLAEQGGEA